MSKLKKNLSHINLPKGGNLAHIDSYVVFSLLSASLLSQALKKKSVDRPALGFFCSVLAHRVTQAALYSHFLVYLVDHLFAFKFIFHLVDLTLSKISPNPLYSLLSLLDLQIRIQKRMSDKENKKVREKSSSRVKLVSQITFDKSICTIMNLIQSPHVIPKIEFEIREC